MKKYIGTQQVEAETFNKAYKLADTPLDRLIIEHQELRDKIDKLKKNYM